MKKELLLNNVIVKKSFIHGYGVFANQDYEPNQIIEESYCLISGREKDSVLWNYYFKDINGSLLIVLGNGSIYNHSDKPNLDYIYDSERSVMVFQSKRFIAKGEELFISYGKNWFDDRSFNKKELPWFRATYKAILGMPLRAIIACSVIWAIVFTIRLSGHH